MTWVSSSLSEDEQSLAEDVLWALHLVRSDAGLQIGAAIIVTILENREIHGITLQLLDWRLEVAHQ